MITIDNIKSLMQPITHPDYQHTALIDATDGIHAVNLALLRWAAGSKQINLTQYELPADAVGRIYVIDVFIGQVVSVRYADWAKGIQRGKRGHGSPRCGKKGKYLTAPHVHLDCIQTGKRRHYRPGVHLLVAFVYPPLREQYAQAAFEDMTANNRSFQTACVQVNHLDKDTHNNSACNLEVVTASDNCKHSHIAKAGEPFSMILHKADFPELRECLTVLSDAPGYIERMCQQVSAAQLPADIDILTVSIQSITGSKTKPVQIFNQSIWGILVGLYTAKAHHICA